MKKSIALLLVLMLALSGCAGRKTEPETTNQTESSTRDTGSADPSTQNTAPAFSDNGALRVLETVWALYGEDERFFASGGHPEHAVDNAPGSYDITDGESLTFGLLVPEGQLPHLKEAASIVHAMNSNILSAAAFRLSNGTDTRAFAQAMRDAIQNNQWLCGFPETLLIALVDGEYVVTAFGQEPMETFEAKLKQAYPNAQILYNEPVK